MAEQPQNTPAEAQKKAPDLPPIIEEPGSGGTAYRAFQKQDPNATTWESHIGSMLGSLSFISILTYLPNLFSDKVVGGVAGGLAEGGVLSGLAFTGAGLVLPLVLGLGLSAIGGYIGSYFGKARVERENQEGKVYTQPTALNREAVEQGLSGAFIWKALTAVGLALGMGGLGYLGVGIEDGLRNTIVMVGSIAAATFGGLKGLFAGASQGKARMEREFRDVETIHAIQHGKAPPLRAPSQDISSYIGPVAGVAAGITSAVDPATVIHHIPGMAHASMESEAPKKAAPEKRAHDFSYLAEAHPAAMTRKSFAGRELKNRELAAQQEVTLH